MKVLFDHPNPFLLAHGGFQIQIEQTKAALEKIGVQVEYLRWWEDAQRGDIIHYFGRPSLPYIHHAHQKELKVVLAQLLAGLGSRAPWARRIQRLVIASSRNLLPRLLTEAFGWDAFRLADACVANTPWEAQLMTDLFGAPRAKVHVLPNGVEDAFFHSEPQSRGAWLICTATVTERKRVVEVAQAATLAQTPLWIIGKPYSASDEYARRFFRIAQEHPKTIRYEGAIRDRSRLAKVYRSARGFVLLSTMETRSLSAEEAAACECPLLLSDLPWARSVFREHASYCPIASPLRTAPVLRRFYDSAPTLPVPPKPLTWLEVARQLKTVYESLLKTSR